MANNTDSDFSEAPAPWKRKGECFWLFGYMKSETYPGPSSFHPLEGVSSFADPAKSGIYQGGVAYLMVTRYSESPCGPYDELIWMPGQFTVPSTGRKAMRITRMYVSNKDSLYNGRKNWNACKDLAHFTFIPRGDPNPSALPYSRIAVANPDTPDAPFFVVDLEPTMCFSSGSIPFNSDIFPHSMLQTVNPPLPQSIYAKEDGQIGTENWVAFVSHMKGKAGFFKSRGGLGGGAYADNIGFPDVKPWSIGMWLREFELEFPVPDILDKKYQ